MTKIILIGDSLMYNFTYRENHLKIFHKFFKDIKYANFATRAAKVMDVLHQIIKMPKDATHVYLLVGTNNVLKEEAHTISHIIRTLACIAHNR